MKKQLHKYFALALALTHLAAAAGYAGIEHHCLLHQHAQTVETTCCCVEETASTMTNPETPACCPAETACASPAPENSGPTLANPVCCELVSLYHRVEESGPPASAMLVQAASGHSTLIPHTRSFSAASLFRTETSCAADRLTLPLLI